MQQKNNLHFFIAVAFSCVICDVISKNVINGLLELNEKSILIPNILSFEKVYNTGAAFSIMQNHTAVLTLFAIITLLIILIYVFINLLRLTRQEMIAFGFIFGGAFGNLTDRFFYGHVTDFIQFDFINFPIFNIADIFINIGVFILIINMLFVVKKMNNNLISCEIEEVDAGKRIDVYLSEFLADFSRSRIQKLIKNGESIKVNNQSVKTAYTLKFGDLIEMSLPELAELQLPAQNLNLDVVYENDDFLVVNKPFGMLTHPTSVERENTLVNGLLYHCKGNLSGINGILRPGIVHRLDRDTSGLLVVAKNDFAHNNLAKQIKEKTALRNYLTVVCGNIKDDTGAIDLPIDRSRTEKCKMAVHENGKPSVTQYKVLERFGDYTYIEVSLKTGRTHQIRVHFSYLKHPVYGDKLYGGGNVKVKTTAQVLQAYKLSLNNPGTNERMTFEVPPDADLTKVLKYLRAEKNKKKTP